MNADLHIHSNCSDGSDSIKDLLNNIIKSGIHIFALTDHDTVEGIPEMLKIVPSNIKFIPGVELTCKTGDIKCHILGFGCNYNNNKLKALIKKGKILRKIKLEARIEHLRKNWNIILTNDELNWLYSRKSVVKTHVANILVKRGLANDNLSAMEKYLDTCKTGDTKFSCEEAIDAILEAGGIPVWAHPLGGEGESHDTPEIFLPKLEQMKLFGIKGLECYYSRYNQEECEFLTNTAAKNNLFISGGSDYHGTNKTNITLGMLNSEKITIDSNKLTILSALT